MLYLLHDYIRNWLVAHDLYRFTQVLDRIEFRAMSASGVAFIIVLLLGPRTIGWLTRKKVGDSGLSDAEILRGHASSKTDVPTMGGILMVGSIGAAATRCVTNSPRTTTSAPASTSPGAATSAAGKRPVRYAFEGMAECTRCASGRSAS